MIACNWLQTTLSSQVPTTKDQSDAKRLHTFGKALCTYTCCLDKLFLTRSQFCKQMLCMTYATCTICLYCEVGHECINLNAAFVTCVLLLYLVIHMQLTWPDCPWSSARPGAILCCGGLGGSLCAPCCLLDC